MDYMKEVINNVNLKEGKALIEQFLIYIYMHQPVSNKDLARTLLIPIPVVTAIKKEFIKLDILEQNKGIQLTSLGIHFVEQELKYRGLNLLLYNDLFSSEEENQRYIMKLKDEISDIYESRPQVDVTIDQALCTTETAIKRAVLCLRNNSLIGKNILCVGDDDLVSIALGFLLRDLFKKAQKPKANIVVFDVDTRLVKYINEISKEYDLPIECELLDLRAPLPLRFANKFDCFFTDPPYTLEGLTLFLSRGIGALKKDKGNKIFLSFGQKAIQETFEMQNLILSHGLSINKIYESFNKYNGASILGNISQMIVLESTEYIKSVVSPETLYEKPIYTRELKSLTRQYKCKKCNEIITMSTQKVSEVETIERLKSKGCPQCGNKSFTLLRKEKKAEKEVQKEKKGKEIQLHEKKSLGVHILADFFDCNSQILKSEILIKEYMHEAAKRANAAIVFEEFHSFNPWGISGAIIIKESHLTIHTWPEYKYAAVDLFTCSDSLDLMEALNYLKEKLEAKNMEYSNIARGIFIKIYGLLNWSNKKENKYKNFIDK